MKNKYMVSIKDIVEYHPLLVEARTEEDALSLYESFYLKGLIGRTQVFQKSAELQREEVTPNAISPLLRDEQGLVKPIE